MQIEYNKERNIWGNVIRMNYQLKKTQDKILCFKLFFRELFFIFPFSAFLNLLIYLFIYE